MKKIKIILHNKRSCTCVASLCFFAEKGKPHLLLDYIDVSVKLFYDEKPPQIITYVKFIEFIQHQPIAAKVLKSTNNRQLYFHTLDMYGMHIPCYPQLSPSKKKWKKDEEWDESKHNIADTKEGFIFDVCRLINVKIHPNEKFTLNFKVLHTIQSVPFLEKSFTPKL